MLMSVWGKVLSQDSLFSVSIKFAIASLVIILFLIDSLLLLCDSKILFKTKYCLSWSRGHYQRKHFKRINSAVINLNNIRMVNSHFNCTAILSGNREKCTACITLLMHIFGMLSVTEKALPANRVCGLYDLPWKPLCQISFVVILFCLSGLLCM